jgi:sporulation protein YlmC with PRC-barrel domain
MAEFTESYDFEGRTLVDRDGEKLGKVEELYMDDRGGQPEWALVHSGLFGMKKTFVPLQGSQSAGEDVRVPIEKAQVKDAPHIDPDGRLSEEEEQRLFEHYGVPYTTAGSTTATGAPGSSAQAQSRVGTEQVERGRGRLRKYVVREQMPGSVPVSHGEVRAERVDTDDVDERR